MTIIISVSSYGFEQCYVNSQKMKFSTFRPQLYETFSGESITESTTEVRDRKSMLHTYYIQIAYN